MPFPLHLLTSPLKTSWQCSFPAQILMAGGRSVVKNCRRSSGSLAGRWMHQLQFHRTGSETVTSVVWFWVEGRHYKLSLIWSITNSPKIQSIVLLSEFVSSCNSCSKLTDDRCIQVLLLGSRKEVISYFYMIYIYTPFDSTIGQGGQNHGTFLHIIHMATGCCCCRVGATKT